MEHTIDGAVIAADHAKKKQMRSTPTAHGVDEIVGRWRQIVMDKKRQIITPEELVELKINFLKNWIYLDPEPVGGWEYREFRYTRKREREYFHEDWRPIQIGENWGGPDVSAEFRTTAQLPERYRGKKVVLKVYFSGDGMLRVNGKPYQGLDPFRDTVRLTDNAQGGESYDLEAECYIMWHAGEEEIKKFEVSHFAVFDQGMNDIFWDLKCACKVMMTEEIDPGVRQWLAGILERATKGIDHFAGDIERVRAMAREAAAIVRKEIYESEVFRGSGLMHMVGNSHLDICFMWTHAEFVRKLGRTHATTLRLMEQYPDYTFCQSQPLMYEEMRENFPDIYEQVKQRVKEGRWEVIGAFYVEPDCNLVSGESFTRQLLYGIRFIEKEFGVIPRTAWIPDVFGNMWSMPQILVKAGLKYFVTHKMILWNDTNKWTKNVFWWEGPDGSRIFAHVPPSGFIGTCEPDHMATHWQRYSDKATIGESLYNYGWGDGGGGPDTEMLESIKRYENFPGLTPTKNSTNEECLENMRQKAIAQGDAIPVHNDELYLEEHRGVHTTKAIFKKLNRYCEHLYRKAELFACVAAGDYPQADLEQGWKVVLLNQFHDSLPGSHVRRVYHDLIESYDLPVKTGESVVASALDTIVERVDTQGEGQAVVVFNSQPHERNPIVKIERVKADCHVVDGAGREMAAQFVENFETGKMQLHFRAMGVPAGGYKVFWIREGKGKAGFEPVAVTANSLENDHLKLIVNDQGEIISLVEKADGREFIDAERHGNVFHLYEDEVGRHEAWDISNMFEQIEFDMGTATVEVCETGPLRSSLKVTRPFQNSKIIQRIVLTRDGRRVDFETYIDWHEQHRLLKVRFNTNILSRTATYDIPYAAIERATTRNNSFEEAKFEVPAHLWMDISQADRGLSLLNDCKYGHEAHGKMIGLSLLKGPTFPDPESDLGEHWFTYSLYPHQGGWREGGTVAEALDLNHPVDTIEADSHAGDLGNEQSFVSIDTPGVVLETFKKAEDSQDWIVRVSERHGAENDVTIKLDATLKKASECNLLEQDDQPVSYEANSLRFTIRPYEIRTFKLTP